MVTNFLGAAVTPQLTPHDNRPYSINCMHLEHVLGQIEPDCGNLPNGWLPSGVSMTATCVSACNFNPLGGVIGVQF